MDRSHAIPSGPTPLSSPYIWFLGKCTACSRTVCLMGMQMHQGMEHVGHHGLEHGQHLDHHTLEHAHHQALDHQQLLEQQTLEHSGKPLPNLPSLPTSYLDPNVSQLCI